MCTRNQALDIFSQAYRLCSDLFADKLTDAYLYGSYARGDFDSESDVDIILVSALPADAIWPKRRQISRIANAVSLDHDVTVSVCVRSREQFQPQWMPYYRNVINDGIRYSRA